MKITATNVLIRVLIFPSEWHWPMIIHFIFFFYLLFWVVRCGSESTVDSGYVTWIMTKTGKINQIFLICVILVSSFIWPSKGLCQATFSYQKACSSCIWPFFIWRISQLRFHLDSQEGLFSTGSAPSSFIKERFA